MPTTLAFIALLGWPVAAAFLFYSQKFEKAIIWAVVIPFLFLPSSMAIDLPGLPPLDRISVPNAALFALVLFAAGSRFKLLPRSNLAKLFIAMLLIGPFFTVALNTEPFFAGPRPIRGTKPFDAVSSFAESFLLIIPFLIARNFLAEVDRHRDILWAILWSGLVYSLLVLVEVRLSPQLHVWFYGFFPHSFLQQIREGGFRPVVFLNHGLWVAFFIMTVAVSAAILWRDAGQRMKGMLGVVVAYMSVVLVLCKSLASLVYCIALLPIVTFLTPQVQVRVATIMVILALTYPALRGADLFPIGPILSVAETVDADRASSLQDRIDNEDILLDRAQEKPLFGWGGWGRSRVYNDRGKNVSVTDGRWIILFGTYGWVGLIGFFGLLALPVFAVARQVRRPEIAAQVSPITSGLCLLLAINMIEFLPNSTLPMMTMLIGGALLGYAERLKDQSTITETTAKPDAPPRPRTIL